MDSFIINAMKGGDKEFVQRCPFGIDSEYLSREETEKLLEACKQAPNPQLQVFVTTVFARVLA